jgi:hypothetical protein
VGKDGCGVRDQLRACGPGGRLGWSLGKQCGEESDGIGHPLASVRRACFDDYFGQSVKSYLVVAVQHQQSRLSQAAEDFEPLDGVQIAEQRIVEMLQRRQELLQRQAVR